MSKTVEELQRDFRKAFIEAKGSTLSAERAGIAAVVRAVRDEFGRIMYPGDDWNRQGILEQFDQILAPREGGSREAGGPLSEEARALLSSWKGHGPLPEGQQAPAAPAPVCVWNLIERKQGGIAAWSSDHLWHAFFAYEKAPLICNDCGLPIKFTEAKT